VPIPYIDVTAPNTQIVGQSLTLECSVTTVRGITSRVDIVWSSDGVELEKSEGHFVNSTTHNSVAYFDTYTIPQLSTTNDGQQLQCKVVINRLLPVLASDHAILDVSGKWCIIYLSMCR